MLTCGQNSGYSKKGQGLTLEGVLLLWRNVVMMGSRILLLISNTVKIDFTLKSKNNVIKLTVLLLVKTSLKEI